MKLLKFENLGKYNFSFKFEDGSLHNSNIEQLVKNKINEFELKTAQINSEWGCLEFKTGLIDIEPKTLYNFCRK